MRIALDTNVIAYFVNLQRGADDVPKIARIREILERLRSRVPLVIASQVLGELFNVLVKAGAARDKAREIINVAAAEFEVISGDAAALLAAADLAVDHRLQIWDALILTVSAEAECTLFLTEDLHEGFATRGMTVIDPFASPLHPRLSALLGE